MALMSSNDDMPPLTPPLRQQLLRVASETIHAGLRGARAPVRVGDYPEPLRQLRASFVTLHYGQRLRGCIGNLDGERPLVDDVARNAYGAAFEDPRFPPLVEAEFAGLDIHLSILSLPEEIMFSSEADLIAQLRPHADGLVLEEGRFRGTFLPSVWAQMPDPQEFLRQLKCKSGLRPDYWSKTLRIKRYRVESIP